MTLAELQSRDHNFLLRTNILEATRDDDGNLCTSVESMAPSELEPFGAPGLCQLAPVESEFSPETICFLLALLEA